MKTLNGQDIKKLFLSGANNLYNHYPEIDQLNVFPVPDGDTGMNMNLTLTSGAKSIMNRNDENIYEIASTFASALMMGARGNSGVITSQIFRGFSNGVTGKEAIDVLGLAEAWVEGKKVAYKSVKNPVEGTILTVIRESSEALLNRVKKKNDLSIEDAFSFLLEEARKSLEHTPDLLPVLKEVGVVDSGGAGLVVVIEGMLKALQGKFVERTDMNDASREAPKNLFLGEGKGYAGAKLSEGEEGYGYCTQFLLRLGRPEEGKRPFIEKKFQSFLASHGNSIVLIHDEGLVKVHVHTLSPGTMLSYAQNYGEFLTITIENMSEEHDNISHGNNALDMDSNIERNRKKKEWAENATIVVSSGKGLDVIFKDLGASYIVSGGQTMNPSTEDFTKAIEEVHAHNVYLFPNNPNIILTATQAAELLNSEEVSVKVVPSATIPEGLSSLMQFNPEEDKEICFNNMCSVLSQVKSGSVTFATRDTEVDGVQIFKDQYLAMSGKHNIISCVPNKLQALRDVLEKMVDEDSSLITIFIGEDVSQEESEAITVELAEKYPLIDLDIRRGDQPIYSFLVGIE